MPGGGKCGGDPRVSCAAAGGETPRRPRASKDGMSASGGADDHVEVGLLQTKVEATQRLAQERGAAMVRVCVHVTGGGSREGGQASRAGGSKGRARVERGCARLSEVRAWRRMRAKARTSSSEASWKCAPMPLGTIHSEYGLPPPTPHPTRARGARAREWQVGRGRPLVRGARPQRGARERGEGDEADEVVVLEHHAVRACEGRAGVVAAEGQAAASTHFLS